jgi:MFS family permease
VRPRHGADRGERARIAALCTASGIGSLGLAAGGTAGGPLIAAISGDRALAGLPVALLVIGSAAAALLISRRSARAGRTGSLALGYVAGAIGSLVVVGAAALGSVAALLAGSTLLGAANAAVFLTRYAATDVAAPAARGRALGSVLTATAVGAVTSPNLLGPAGALAHALGLPRLAGLYLVAPLAYTTAAAALAAIPAPPRRPAEELTARRLGAAFARPPVPAALGLLALANLVMVAVMAVAPVAMMAAGTSVAVVGAVVSVHVAGMFGPSPLTGRLADRAGPRAVAALGAALVVVAGAAGAVIPAGDTAAATAALVLLGVGWNCGVVGGSALLAASVPAPLRTHVEGIGETAMGVAAAAGAPMAGVLLALAGLPAVWLVTAAAAVVALRVARTGAGSRAPARP